MCGVAEVNLGFFALRKRFDARIFLLQPFLHQRLVAFQRAAQRFLTGDAKLCQEPPNRRKAQRDVEFALDQRRHHLARPQRKFD